MTAIAEAEPAGVVVQDLRVEYEHTLAVDGVSFTIEPGDIYGLIGPNGAGKTSTIKAMVGLIEPTTGDIGYFGYDLRRKREDALVRVGYAPDLPPIYEDLTVYQYLDFFAAAYRIPEAVRADRIEGILEKVNLLEKRDEMAIDLSRGMGQRLVIAKSFLHNPPVLIMDEPAGGLDPTARIELRETLKEYVKDGSCVLVSSHILAELSGFCTAVGIMEQGRMVVTGRIDDIVERIRAHLVLVIDLLEERNGVADFLRGQDGVLDVREEGLRIEADFTGGKDGAAALLRRLVLDGAPVLGFAQERPTLEDIFVQVGATKVS